MSSAGFPSKSGGVNIEDYTTNGMILEFGAISQALQSEFDQEGSNPVLQPAHISELVASIINFQEKHCGINAVRPRPFTRFPYAIFRDYKTHGHLHRLLRIMISYCASQPWYKTKYQINSDNINHRLLITLNDQSLLNKYFDMFNYIKKQLKKQQIIKDKIIYFSPLISTQSQQKLAQIARNHGATIFDQANHAVTHIILPNNADMEDSSDEHVRTVDKQEDLAYIHYWFYPSSYDQWISNDLIDGDAEHIEPPQGAWRVGERFLTDLDTFNEWMVELDYEVLDNTPEPQIQPQSQIPTTFSNGNTQPQPQSQSQPQPHSHSHLPGTMPRIQSPQPQPQIQPQIFSNPLNTLAQAALQTQRGQSRKRKRDRHPMVEEDEIGDPDGEWIPPSKKHKNMIDLAHSDIGREEVRRNAVDLTHGNRNIMNNINNINNINSIHKPQKKLKFKLKRRKNPATYTSNADTIKKEVTSKKKGSDPILSGGDIFPFCGPSLTRIRPIITNYPIVIPSYARWFRLDRIHPIEYQNLDSLFKNKAMQYHERYMQIRNFIINSYRINPRIYITVTSCRRMIAGDAGSVLRIHKFLEEWGLINYQCDDGSIPEFELPMVDYTHVDTPFGVKIALKRDMSHIPIGSNIISNRKQKIKDVNKQMSVRENIFYIAEQEQKENKYDIVCTFCDMDCSQGRYRCNIHSDMILCKKCFDDKRYGMVFDDNDFEMELQPIQSIKNCEEKDNNNDMDVDMKNNNKTFRIETWNDNELKKLKTGLNLYHDDWKKVSEYVGRDEQECIAQFIQLPIKDTFLDNIEGIRDGDINKIYHPQISNYLSTNISNNNNNNNNNNKSHMLSFLNPNPKYTPSPFNDIAHPVLSQAASLSAMVNSELVNIASSAALQFVTKQKIIQEKQLKINHIVDTKMGRGIIQQINGNNNNNNNKEYVIKYEWGEAKLKFNDIIDIVEGDDWRLNDGNGNHIGSWQQYPQNISESKAKAAGILGASATIAKALKQQKDGHIEQLLQHLVLLQSQKVKAKLAHLEELWNVLQEEREEIQEMKQELFRERIEIAKIKFDLQDGEDYDDDIDDDDDNINVKTQKDK